MILPAQKPPLAISVIASCGFNLLAVLEIFNPWRIHESFNGQVLLPLVAAAVLIASSGGAADIARHAEDRRQLLHLMAAVEIGINAQNSNHGHPRGRRARSDRS